MNLLSPITSRLRWLRDPGSVSERNIRNVLIDGVGVGLVSGVATFLPVFLARLGASNMLVGLLSALPALAGALFALPVGSFLGRQKNIVPWYSKARIWVLGSYALFGLMPFLFPESAIPWAVIAIWALVTIPSTIVNVAFTLVMSGVAGPQRRMYLMSRRWGILGITTSLTVALVGVILETIVFPLNYQIIFIASFLGGVLSYIFSSAITLPDNPPSQQKTAPSWISLIKQGWQGLRSTPAFAAFVSSSFIFRCGIGMGLPLFPLYWVRVAQASDASIGLISMANSSVLLVAYFAWANWARRYGAAKVLIVTSLGLGLYPLMTAFTPSIALLILYAAFSGFCAAGNDLVNFDLLLDTCPKEDQATYVGFYQTTQNFAVFLMPLIGTLIADYLGIGVALFVAGGLRILGSLLFYLFKVGRTQTVAAAS